mmetsp:Transcript_120358/g.376556  ORF Transcript_120358/g.376556 Transcript_120358/m.376556 type:complete len:88 (+) Transcript_120358:33-296(+)
MHSTSSRMQACILPDSLEIAALESAPESEEPAIQAFRLPNDGIHDLLQQDRLHAASETGDTLLDPIFQSERILVYPDPRCVKEVVAN